MKLIVFILLLLSFSATFADAKDLPEANLTPLQVNLLFDKTNSISLDQLTDFLQKKEERINICVTDYISRQKNSYAKLAQNNLYDLIHNFEKVISKLYGKSSEKDNLSQNEKIRELANIQCKTYYFLGILK